MTHEAGNTRQVLTHKLKLISLTDEKNLRVLPATR